MLFPSEIVANDWLKFNSLSSQPYDNGCDLKYYKQFESPLELRSTESFIRIFLSKLATKGDSLLTITDWDHYSASEMLTIQAIRLSKGETRFLKDSPHHQFSVNEHEEAIALFSLSVSYGFSSYLYCPQYKSILYNWEGELMDFWTDDSNSDSFVGDLLNQYNLTLNSCSQQQ